MKVIVCVEGTKLSAQGRAALVAAVRLADKSQVIAICAGLPGRTDSLAEARALGVGRAIHIADPGLDGGHVLAAGHALAAVARHLEADLVLTGTRSGMEGRGVMPAAIAHYLEFPIVSRVESLLYDPAVADKVTATIRAAGRKRYISIRLPAVVTVAAAVPIETTAAHDQNDADAAIEVVSPSDFGVETSEFEGVADSLGALDRPRRRPVLAASAPDLLAHWRG